jgi:hypothetical protein
MMIQSHSSLELALLMVRNGALAGAAALLIRALLASSQGPVVSRARAKRAFRFGIGLLVLGGLAEIVVVGVGHAPVTSKGCTRSGAEVLCAGPPMVKVREVDGWNVVHDEAAQTLRAEREGAGALFINSFTNDASSVAELAQELARQSDGGPEGGCVLSKEGVTAGGRPGVALGCRLRNIPSRQILVQRGPHVYTSLQCVAAAPEACDPVLRTLEWVRPEDPRLGAQF